MRFRGDVVVHAPFAQSVVRAYGTTVSFSVVDRLFASVTHVGFKGCSAQLDPDRIFWREVMTSELSRVFHETGYDGVCWPMYTAFGWCELEG